MKKRTEIPGNVSSASPELKLARAERNARDIEIVNRNADQLNAEAEDALEYQAPWDTHDADAEDIHTAKKKGRKQ
jgi:hypothetical protein